MPLNYESFDVKDGNQDGVLEVHHEFLKICVGDQVTILDLEHVVEVRVTERDPQWDRLWFRTSAGDWHKFTIDSAGPCVDAIPASFHIGW